MICSFDGCLHPVHSKRTSLCRSHQRQAAAGKPLTFLQEGPIEVRFWWNVNKAGPTAPHMDSPCWVWTGSTSKYGYGRIGTGAKDAREQAHRVSYRLATGADPGDLVVRHKCDVRSCVRPDHLLLGEHADNVRDAVERHRMASGDRHGLRKKPERAARGERHGRSKLTEPEVVSLRAASAAGESRNALAARFGVSASTVGEIVRRDKWTHVP